MLGALAGVVIIVVVLTTITPLPAILSFRVAWGPNAERNAQSNLALLVFPTTVCPLLLLLLYSSVTQPEWKQFGSDHIRYLAKGSAALTYFPPFAAANFLVARTILDRNYAKATLLPELSLLTCILICLYFGLKEITGASVFPLSCCISYSYGLVLFVKLHGTPQWLFRHFAFIIVWILTSIVTVFASIARTKQMVADLPDESPGCFVVSAAAHGHRFVVRSEVDALTGQTVNNQLKVFRAFETSLAKSVPRVHQLARRMYNRLGPWIARKMIFRWQADLMYILLKPFEWAIRLARFS